MQDEKDLQQPQDVAGFPANAPQEQAQAVLPDDPVNGEEQMELPENAFRPLKEGEKYIPILRPEKNYPEVTPYSVSLGLIMAVIFSAAAAYLGLKVGQVFEAAIPIAIIAAGIAGVTKRKNSLGENVIIQSIGAASGIVVAGAIFTLPALYILKKDFPEMTVHFLEVFLSSMLGGLLGILLFIPFRKYFVKDKHGEFPFPEATATTQVLVQGQKGGDQAKPLLIAGLIGGLYDFVIHAFGWWKEILSANVITPLQGFIHDTKMTFNMNATSAVLGLGFIIGLKYSFIIFAGSAFIWWVIIPLFAQVSPTLAALDTDAIFSEYARPIGIGGIAMSGILGIIKSWSVIKNSVGLIGQTFKKNNSVEKPERNQRDISMKALVFALCAALLATFLFFLLGVTHNLLQSSVAFLVVLVISFLFTTVAANAIAIVGSNPVSGMTLMTLIVASGVFVAVGIHGWQGIVAAMIIGGVVCTALSMAGGMVTDMKIGYWIGTTPAKQQSWKMLGTIVSAATVGGVILLLSTAYDFNDSNAIAAPQARTMAAVIKPLMTGQPTPWILYICGAILALMLNWLKVPALPFSLGMVIPFAMNSPLLIGGVISWFVSTRSKDEKLNKARMDKGTLIASGFIAGGALMGVVSAGMKIGGFEYESPLSDGLSGIIGLAVYILLISYFIYSCLRAKKAE